ncbi:MAG: NADH-dependent alcohol dehydrogenase [Dorea sp. 42_8]|nr:MAG: NADH-dependent alcohol dehydrogenase [Dorea sp. 42_8]
MYNFNYYTPTKVVFGKNTEDQCGELVKEQGCKKVLIHYGSGSVRRSGLLDKVKASLDDAEVDYIELGGAVPNPRLSLVYEGIELAKKEGVDFILAVGGGSAIDSAKAIGYGVANEGDVWDFYDRKRQATGCLPIGVVLTIAATGSEMSNSSVITKEEGWVKRGYSSDYGRPRFAIMNPELTMTLPDYQTACGCTDILMHTMERYFTNGGNMEITDSIAEGLMRTVIENARILVRDPKNYDARAEVMWAGSLSHNGLTGCGAVVGGDFASHALEHEIGGIYDVAHGAGLAAIWGSWARYVYKDCLPRFEKFAMNVMQVDPEGTADDVALRGIEAMEDFYHEIGMPVNFKELGIAPTDEQIKEMADSCARASGGHKGSAKDLYPEDMIAIYRMANQE